MTFYQWSQDIKQTTIHTLIIKWWRNSDRGRWGQFVFASFYLVSHMEDSQIRAWNRLINLLTHLVVDTDYQLRAPSQHDWVPSLLKGSRKSCSIILLVMTVTKVCLCSSEETIDPIFWYKLVNITLQKRAYGICMLIFYCCYFRLPQI